MKFLANSDRGVVSSEAVGLRNTNEVLFGRSLLDFDESFGFVRDEKSFLKGQAIPLRKRPSLGNDGGINPVFLIIMTKVNNDMVEDGGGRSFGHFAA